MDPEAVTQVLRLVRGCQAGVLLDTNVLLLHIAMLSDRASALEWKSTKQFGPDHVLLLEAVTFAARRIVTTPHVLTEATNLADRGVPSLLRERVLAQLRKYALETLERHVEAKRVANDPQFSRLGLADLAQAFIGRRARPLIITTDAPLCAELEKRRVPVLNLNHYVWASAPF